MSDDDLNKYVLIFSQKNLMFLKCIKYVWITFECVKIWNWIFVRKKVNYLFDRANQEQQKLTAERSAIQFCSCGAKKWNKIGTKRYVKKDVENGAKTYEKWFKLNNFGNYFLAVNIQMLYVLPTTVYTFWNRFVLIIMCFWSERVGFELQTFALFFLMIQFFNNQVFQMMSPMNPSML